MRHLSDIWPDDEHTWRGRLVVTAIYVVGLLLLGMVPR